MILFSIVLFLSICISRKIDQVLNIALYSDAGNSNRTRFLGYVLQMNIHLASPEQNEGLQHKHKSSHSLRVNVIALTDRIRQTAK